MRTVGAAAVLLASFGIGCLSVCQMQMHLRTLREIRDALLFLRGELAFKQVALPELIRNGCRYTKGEANDFFLALTDEISRLGEKCFHELWEETVERRLFRLSEPEKRELITMGRQLGCTALPQQLSALDACIHALSETLEREEDEYRRERKARVALPASVGAVLLILLL